MPRPRKCRLVKGAPQVDYFKPRGIPMHQLTEVYLPVEGYEALRLAELEGLNQEEAAASMNVSRHTFGRILAEARHIVAQAVVTGKALCIDGGHYEIQDTRVAGKQQEATCRGPEQKTIPNKELDMKKIAVSSEGPSLDDLVDPRFGRAAGFLVVDTETKETQYIDNGATQAMAQGAGIQAAQNVADSGAGLVLTGFVGPKAFRALDAAGIQVGQDLGGITVKEAIERFETGEVPLAAGPNR